MYAKKITLLVFTFFLLLHPTGSVGAQDLGFSLITPHLNHQPIRECKRDAARLALGHILEGDIPASADLHIPQNIQNSLFEALMAIYHSSDPHAQKVTAMGIHTKAKPYYIDYITVNCVSGAALTAPLIPGGTSTANPEINTLLEEYKLEIGDYNKEENSFNISAPVPINMSKLAKILSELDDDIEYTLIPEIDEPNHNIEASYAGNDTWIITFIKYENGTQEKWSFEVDGDGQVIYLAEKG